MNRRDLLIAGVASGLSVAGLEKLTAKEVEPILDDIPAPGIYGETRGEVDLSSQINSSEEKLLVARWEQTRLLEGLDDRAKRICAVLMENQRLWNENTDNYSNEECAFKRVSIPLMRRIIPTLVEYPNFDTRLFAKNPEMIPVGWHLNSGQSHNEHHPYPWVRTSIQKVKNLRNLRNLDEEAEKTAKFAEFICNTLKVSLDNMATSKKLYLHCLGWVDDWRNSPSPPNLGRRASSKTAILFCETE